MTFLHSFEMLPHYLFLDSANESNTDLVSGYWMLVAYPFCTS